MPHGFKEEESPRDGQGRVASLENVTCPARSPWQAVTDGLPARREQAEAKQNPA